MNHLGAISLLSLAICACASSPEGEREVPGQREDGGAEGKLEDRHLERSLSAGDEEWLGARESQIEDQEVDGVSVRIDRTDPQAGQVRFEVGNLVQTFDLIRLPAGTRLFHWGRTEEWGDHLASHSISESAFIAEGEAAARGFEQAGLYVSQHPFAWSDWGRDLMVIRLERAYDFVVMPVEAAACDTTPLLWKIAEASSAPRQHWMSRLGELGIGGISGRIRCETDGPSAAGDVFITHSALAGNIHQASRHELLDLLTLASWPAAAEMSRPLSHAKVAATMRCEEAGASREEIFERLRGPQWAWLREAVDPRNRWLSERPRQAVWSACEADSQNIQEIPPGITFREQFCDSLLMPGGRMKVDDYTMLQALIGRLCSREDMRRRATWRFERAPRVIEVDEL